MYFILFQLPLCNSTLIQFPVQNFISESLFFYFFLFITEDYQLVKLYFLSTRDSILYQMQYACLIRTWLLGIFFWNFLLVLHLVFMLHYMFVFRHNYVFSLSLWRRVSQMKCHFPVNKLYFMTQSCPAEKISLGTRCYCFSNFHVILLCPNVSITCLFLVINLHVIKYSERNGTKLRQATTK